MKFNQLSSIFLKPRYILPASALGFLYFGTSEQNDPNQHIRGERLKVDPSVQDHHSYTLKNQVWTEQEIVERLQTKHQHAEPKSAMDRVTYWILRGVYTVFNTVTLFDKNDPSAASMRFRLILLESIAGVPPFIMAGYRHFYSLRNMTYDGGRIYTHLEEAENERMHLIACMQVFHAGPVTKALVFAAQVIISPFCWFFCLCNPRFLNRFVGYLEELACETYSTVLDAMDDPEKQLYREWREIPAPPVAIQYWKLDENASWHDTLRRIYADETNHRDVNHCFADLGINERNPLLKHHEEIAKRHANTETVEKQDDYDEEKTKKI